LLLLRRHAAGILAEYESGDVRNVEIGLEQLPEAGNALRLRNRRRQRLETPGAKILNKAGGTLALRRRIARPRRTEQHAQENCADGQRRSMTSLQHLKTSQMVKYRYG